jgi:hypothetical protein
VNPRGARSAACAVLACGTVALCSTGCSGEGNAARDNVERTDSAGVEIVVSSGADRLLDWTFAPVLRIGADEGPAAFGSLYSGAVQVDSRGRFVVLDGRNYHVVLFDARGEHVATYGRKGGGPGELEFPNAIAVDEAGAISVYDFSKRGAIRFAHDGTVLPQATLPPLAGTRIRTAAGRTWGVVMERSQFGEPGALRLLGVAGDTIELLRHPTEEVKPVQFPNCKVTIMMGPLLAPDIHFDHAGSRLAWALSSAYTIHVLEGGRPTRIMRRDVAPEPVTPELAEREVGDSMRISYGSGACTIPPEDVVSARGAAAVVPAMRDVILAPDGALWIPRGVGQRTEWRIDVFDPSGAYTGTLPAGSPLPAAFRGEDEIVTIERDDLDRQSVVVYRVDRGGASRPLQGG